jgi:hypothetical protein
MKQPDARGQMPPAEAFDGRGSAARVHPFSTNGARAARDDPWANDQDWAPVHLLSLEELKRRGP